MNAAMALARGKRRRNIHGSMTETVTAQMTAWSMPLVWLPVSTNSRLLPTFTPDRPKNAMNIRPDRMSAMR